MDVTPRILIPPSEASLSIFPNAKNILERRLQKVMTDIRTTAPWLSNERSKTQISVQGDSMDLRNSYRLGPYGQLDSYMTATSSGEVEIGAKATRRPQDTQRQMTLTTTTTLDHYHRVALECKFGDDDAVSSTTALLSAGVGGIAWGLATSRQVGSTLRLFCRYYGEEEGYAQQLVLQADKRVGQHGSCTATVANSFDSSGLASTPHIGMEFTREVADAAFSLHFCSTADTITRPDLKLSFRIGDTCEKEHAGFVHVGGPLDLYE